MHLLIVYDNPQHRFIKNMVVTVNADGTPPTQTPNSAKGALVFDVPDGAQTLTLTASIPNPEAGEPPLLNVNQSCAKVTLSNGTAVWQPTSPRDRRVTSAVWVGASKTSSGVFQLKLDLLFLDLTDYASKLNQLSDPTSPGNQLTPFTFAPAHGSTFAVLECTDPFPTGSTGTGAVTWACLIPPAVTSPGSPPAAVGTLLFLRPTSSDRYTNTDDVASNTGRLTRYVSDPPASQPFYVENGSFIPTPFCGWEAQIVGSGKSVVLFWPFPHGSDHGSVLSSKMPELIRSALNTLRSGGRLGNVGSVPGSRLALGGFSAGGAQALKALRQPGNGARVDELYLFEPADFGLRISQISAWFKLNNKMLRMIAGGYWQSSMISLTLTLADPLNVTCIPVQTGYWYTEPLYEAAVSQPGSLEHFNPVGTVPASANTPSGASGIFLGTYTPSPPALTLSWTPPGGGTPSTFTFPTTPGPVPSHEEAASLVHWRLIPLYSAGQPVADQQTFMKIMNAITVVPSGETGWPPGEKNRIPSIRHEWTVVGGEGATGRQAGFKGFLQICLEASQF
jgi:hypothetical protein